jgi:dihydroxyacetone kinase-like protein
MKKIIVGNDAIVETMLNGVAFAHPGKLRRLEGFNVITRRSINENKVALVSGGGSGHEPAHAGFVGRGMLDAAVAGEVFTSPTPDQVLGAIKAVSGSKGVLLIIKNYSGDVMNFEMAAEMAEMEGIGVAKVIVNDDVAVMNSTYTTGRRGIAGTVFVHKVAGAKAELGASLPEVLAVAEKAVANTRSKGCALSPCIVPAVGKPTFTLDEGEMEIGLGIHGEPGVKRVPMMGAEQIAEDLAGSAAADLGLASGDKVALLVNGLGATPLMELYILAACVGDYLSRSGIEATRVYVREFMTSLEMAGASVSLMRLDDELLGLLDKPCDTPAWTQL